MYCFDTCSRFFWCLDSLFSHNVQTHGEIMKNCTCTTEHWEGTEKVWSFLDKKAKQSKHSETGDVMLKSNDNHEPMNHESLTKLYPIKVKKVKEVKAPKENKSEQVKIPKAKRAIGVGRRALPVAVGVAVGNTVAKTAVVKAATKKAIKRVRHTVKVNNSAQVVLDEIVGDEIHVVSLLFYLMLYMKMTMS